MISRRLLRIKLMQILFAFFKSNNNSVSKSEKELFHSIDKTFELYHYFLILIIDIANYAESKIDLARKKNIPTKEDLNPNTKFIDNKIINQISINKQLKTYLNNVKLSWVNNPELIKNLYLKIIESEDYKSYMQADNCTYSDDKKFIMKIFEKHIANSELLFQTIEEQSIYWNDDIEFVLSMIIKTIKKFNEKDEEKAELLKLYKSEDDIEFIKTIFRKTILNHEDNVELIRKNITNWDIDRIAFMDMLLIEIAITEIKEMPSIPIKVSFNEYLEIAKFYSTGKSSIFINGILDKIINNLKAENKIIKKGKGLIG